MQWKEYTDAIQPLIKAFGAIYSKDEITKGYYLWKSKPKQELITLVVNAIDKGQKLDLLKKPDPPKMPYHKQYVEDGEPVNYETLDKLKNEANVSSLWDLVVKHK